MIPAVRMIGDKMKKLAIIGASYLQEPLIEKAKGMGLETHVFAWQTGDIGEHSADYFYPISIVEKDKILEKCREIGIDGICSIASDLASITVNYVAQNMNLTGNSMECTLRSTNKHSMRQCFEKNGDPSPKSFLVGPASDLHGIKLNYPIIVKPTDRSGSRGITKLYDPGKLEAAIDFAESEGFEKKALVEEFAEGQEYSIECISRHGIHHFLTMTLKYTTGYPHYIETGHLEPAPADEETLERVKKVVFHALDTLMVTDSASHSELKIDSQGNISIIEIGARMGGDFIGSTLVPLTTGIDFTRNVILTALGEELDLTTSHDVSPAAVRFIFGQKDIEAFDRLNADHPDWVVLKDIHPIEIRDVTDSASRLGCYVFRAPTVEQLQKYMPVQIDAK